MNHRHSCRGKKNRKPTGRHVLTDGQKKMLLKEEREE